MHVEEMMMDEAFCAPAERVMYAHEFAALPPVTIEQWRHHLTCTECKNPAYYKRAAKSGPGACFGGNPHLDGCSKGTKAGGNHGAGGAEAEDERYNPGDRIVIDLRLSLAGEVDAPGNPPGERPKPGGRTYGATDGIRRARMHRKARTLLRTLIHTPAFSESDQLIELDDQALPARQFFVPIETKELPTGLRGYWGQLVGARLKDGTIWLNTRNAGIPIDQGELGLLQLIARVGALDQLTNAHVLVLGQRAITGKGKVYFDFQKDLARIALIAPPRNQRP